SVAAALEPPKHWKAALERVATLGDQASAMQGLRSIGLSVQSGSTQTLVVYIDVDDADLAAQGATVIRAWAMSPPKSVQVPWTDVVRSARVQVRERTIVVTLDVSSLAEAR
ncbi:MAG: hypothetical protein JRF54_12990, partial [Deltaproteobacteria bacterium]|nr:hypothetical protein [Deltaproteobacteria bacterium]